MAAKYRIEPDEYVPRGNLAMARWSSTADGQIMTVSMPKEKLSSMYASIAAHEATHIMQFCMAAIGENKPSHEVQARIVEQVTKFILDN